MQLSRASLLSLFAIFGAACSPSVDLPSIEGWTGETQVAAAIEKARDAARAEPSAASIGRLGEFFHAHTLFPEAVACYQLALEKAPEEYRWPYLAALATARFDLESSLALFEQAIERGARHSALFIHLGDTLARLDRGTEAAASYERALVIDPSSSHALVGLARVHLGEDEVATARSHLERAREFKPWHGEARLLLAQTYQRLGLEEEAKSELAAAAAFPDPTQPPDPILQTMLGRAVNSTALIDRGRRLAKAGRYAEAEKLFRRVLAIRPGSADDFANLGGALAGQGKTEAAIAQYEEALALEPENPAALNNLAMALADRGRLAIAIRRLEEALAARPDYAEAHHNLGLLRGRQLGPTAALPHYREALRHNPSFVQAYSDLGTAQADLGELDAAIATWRRALALDPRELAALYNLSVALAGKGEHAEAVRWLKSGLEIAPNSSRLATLLAWELATAPDESLRNPPRAVALARRVAEAYPGRPEPADVLAAGLAAAGRYAEAASLAERAVSAAAAEGDPTLASQIGARLALYRQGRAYRQPV